MSRRTLIPVAALLAALLTASLIAAPDGEARRKPTSKERAAIARAMDRPARCLFIRVSTVSRRWASVRLRNRKRSCARYAADGVGVFRKRKDGRWRFVTAGSAFDCPVPNVPRRVQRDLRIPCMPTG